MEELGSPVPDESGARLHLMRAAAASIIDGEGDPEDLAHEIYWQSSYFPSAELREVGYRFLHLYADCGAAPDQTEEAVAAMKEAARSFLHDHLSPPRPSTRAG